MLFDEVGEVMSADGVVAALAFADVGVPGAHISSVFNISGMCSIELAICIPASFSACIFESYPPCPLDTIEPAWPSTTPPGSWLVNLPPRSAITGFLKFDCCM